MYYNLINTKQLVVRLFTTIIDYFILYSLSLYTFL